MPPTSYVSKFITYNEDIAVVRGAIYLINRMMPATLRRQNNRNTVAQGR